MGGWEGGERRGGMVQLTRWNLAEWLIDRECDLRDATEFAGLPSVFESVDRRRSREVAGVSSHVTSMVSHMVQ